MKKAKVIAVILCLAVALGGSAWGLAKAGNDSGGPAKTQEVTDKASKKGVKKATKVAWEEKLLKNQEIIKKELKEIKDNQEGILKELKWLKVRSK